MAREISIRLAVEDADRVKAVLQSVGATGEQAFAAFERGATAGAQSFSKLERSLDPVVASQQRFAAAQAGINRALEAGLASQERAGQLLDLARRRYLDLDDATTKVATGSSKLGQVIGQAGFQVQDFVVQVGSGQNALVALGQQGSQLLGVFGNFGAVAGAGLAILAMAANMAVGKTAAEKLSDELDRQQAEYEATAKRAQDYQTALRAQGDQYRSAAEAGQRYREGLRGEGETLIQLTRYYQGLTEAKLGYERAQFTTTTQNNATNTFRLGREIDRTLNRPMLQAVPDGAAALDPIAIIGGGGVVSGTQPDYRQATAAIARFRAENKVTEEAVLQLRQALQGAVDLNGSYAASINAIIGGLDTLIPQLERLDEAQRRANNRRLAMAGQASPEQLRALADQAANDVGGTYQQRQRIQELRGDLRGGLAGANPEQTATIRSSLQSLSAQAEGLTPATTQMLRGLQDQARLANVAAGAARELAASDQALDNAARQAGLGQASLGEKTEARRLVQRRLDGQLMDSLEALNRQISGAQDLAAAQLQGAGAAREVEARVRAETETLKLRAETDADYTRIVEVLTTRYVALAEAQALARSNTAELGQQQQLETLRTEAQLVGATVAQRERELAVLRERQKLTQEGVTDGGAQARRLALAGQIADETQALKRQQEAWTELSNVGVQAFDRIGQAITTALSNGQLSTIRFGNIAKAVMAEVVQYFAKVALVNPVLNAVFGSNRTTLGDLGGVVGSVFGGSGSGAAGGGAGSIMIDGIPAAAYTPLAEGVSGPVLSIPAGATYSVDGTVSGLGVLRSAGGVALTAQGGGAMGQLGMLTSGAGVINQLSGGSTYGGIGRSLGLTGQDGLFSGVGESITSTYQNIASTPLWSYGDLTGATSRRLALTAGELRLVNGDGALDALAGDWSVAGRRVVLRRGPHRRPLHAPLTEFSQVADLRAAGAASGTTRLAVPLRPAAVELDVPVCGLYLGTGGLEGPSTLSGQFKRRLYGLKRNVEPVLIDAGLLLYQLHDGPLQQVIAVRDKGVALTAGGDVASYSALASATVASGTYKTCLVVGLVRVGATPSLLTADARGDSDASTGGYNTGSAASIAQKLLRGPGGIAAASGSNFSWPVGEYGLWLRGGTVGQAMEALATGIFGWWGTSTGGLYQGGQLAAPEDQAPSLTIEPWMLAAPPEEIGPLRAPWWRARVGYQALGRTQEGDQLAGAVSATDRTYWGQAWRSAVSANTAISAAYPLAEDGPELIAGFDLQADAQSLADRLLVIFGKPRRLFLARLRGGAAGYCWPTCQLGACLALRWPQHRALASGRPLIVQGVSARGDTTTLTLWG